MKLNFDWLINHPSSNATSSCKDEVSYHASSIITTQSNLEWWYTIEKVNTALHCSWNDVDIKHLIVRRQLFLPDGFQGIVSIFADKLKSVTKAVHLRALFVSAYRPVITFSLAHSSPEAVTWLTKLFWHFANLKCKAQKWNIFLDSCA